MNGLTSRIIKGIASTGLGYLSTIALDFIGLVLAVRLIPKDQFGVYVLLEVVVSLLVILTDLGIGLSATKHLSVCTDRKIARDIVNTTVLSRLAVTLVVCAAAYFSGPLIVLFFKSGLLSQLTVYISALVFLNSVDLHLSYLLRGFHLYKNMAIALVTGSCLKLSLILVFLILFKMELMGLIYATLLSLMASVLMQYLAIPTEKRIRFDPVLIRKLFLFGAPLGLNSILTFVFHKVDTLLVGALLNPISVAYYGVASRIPDSLPRLFQSFEAVFLPNMSELIARDDVAQATTLVNNSLRMTSFITASFALVITLFQTEVVRLVFSERYLESAPALGWLMIALNMEFIIYVLGNTLVACGQPEKPLKCNLITTFVSLAGNLIMIPLSGFLGAAYSRGLSRYASNPFYLWFLNKTKIAVDLRSFLRPIWILWVFLGVFLVLKPEGNMVRLSMIGGFWVACWGLGVFSKKDLSYVLQSLGII